MSGKLIRIECRPDAEVTPEEFIRTHPPFSIALDGYCKGPTFFDPTGPLWNVNHHDGCVREATRSSCKQVFNAIRTGLFKTYQRCGRPHGVVWIGDIDDDVMLSTYMLRHPKHVERPRLRQIVELADLLDTVFGFYPVKKNWHLLKMLVWVMEPYNEARMDGSLKGMDADAMLATLERMHERLRKTMYGKGKEAEPDTRHEILEEHGTFVVIKEIGRYARYELARKGYDSVLAVADRDDGRFQYTLARRSLFIADMPVQDMWAPLNELEGPTPNGDEWGGGNSGGGSPRKSGSRHGYEVVRDVILAKRAAILASRHCSFPSSSPVH